MSRIRNTDTNIYVCLCGFFMKKPFYSNRVRLLPYMPTLSRHKLFFPYRLQYLNVWDFSTWTSGTSVPERLGLQYLNVWDFSTWTSGTSVPERLGLQYLNVWDFRTWTSGTSVPERLSSCREAEWAARIASCWGCPWAAAPPAAQTLSSSAPSRRSPNSALHTMAGG